MTHSGKPWWRRKFLTIYDAKKIRIQSYVLHNDMHCTYIDDNTIAHTGDSLYNKKCMLYLLQYNERRGMGKHHTITPCSYILMARTIGIFQQKLCSC